MARDRSVIHGTAESRAFQRECPAIDLHADTLMWARWLRYDMSAWHRPPLPKDAFMGQVDLPRLRIGGVGAQFFGLVSVPWLRRSGCFRAVHRQIDRFEEVCIAHPRLVTPARSAEDVVRAHAHGRVAGLLGVEGAHALEGDADNVIRLAWRGVRYLGLAHFSANEACCPSAGLGTDHGSGLTPFGRRLVRDCEDHGVIVDLAHVNRRGFMEACRMARLPLIVSHTGVAGAHAHWRNIDDDQLRAVADTGGVVGIIFARRYLGGAELSDVIRHVLHVIRVCGEDHVALGSDYDGMVVMPSALSEVSKLPNLTAALLRGGWCHRRIRKLLRDNVMRVLREVPPRHL